MRLFAPTGVRLKCSLQTGHLLIKIKNKPLAEWQHMNYNGGRRLCQEIILLYLTTFYFF
jgi:hypothetical protein